MATETASVHLIVSLATNSSYC